MRVGSGILEVGDYYYFLEKVCAAWKSVQMHLKVPLTVSKRLILTYVGLL